MRFAGFLFVILFASTVLAQEESLGESIPETTVPPVEEITERDINPKIVLPYDTPSIPLYAAKVAYREYLRQNNLNPTDEEIAAQIAALKENPDKALAELIENAPEPIEPKIDHVEAEAAALQQNRPKRLGERSLYVNPNLF